eukprot:4666617-Prorocentrum_lima.AAC.1
MTSSLVGSEMCIRDSFKPDGESSLTIRPFPAVRLRSYLYAKAWLAFHSCLLYTSDAADDM